MEYHHKKKIDHHKKINEIRLDVLFVILNVHSEAKLFAVKLNVEGVGEKLWAKFRVTAWLVF